MGAPVLQFKRGQFSNLPGLRAGEPGFTTDKFDLYVGIDSTTSSNKFFGSHRYWNRETATVGSSVRVVEGSNNGSNYIELKSPNSLAQNVTYTLPATDVANGILVSDGSGNLSYTTTVTGSGSGLSAGTVPLSSLDIDGGTDIGAAIVDADEFIVDDGGTGTNRKVDASRIKDYVLGGGQGANFSAINVTGITTAAFVDATQLKVSGVSTFTGAIDANGNLDVAGTATFATPLANSNLANSTVSYGGISLALGGSDATPAFDLTDATNYPTSSLTGTITNAQLAGSIEDGKLNKVTTANKVDLSSLDIDGGTDIGAAIVDGDEFIIDDGGNGTNRKTDASRIKDYVLGGGQGANFSAINVTGITTVAFVDATQLKVSGVSTFTGTVDINGAIDADGGANIAGGETVLSSATVSDLTDNRVVIAGASGALEDSGNLTFNGSKLTVTGNAQVTSDLDVDGGANVSGGLVADTAKVSDLTSGRVVLAGTAGEIEDSGNLTFDGSTLAVTGSQTISSNLTLSGNADFNGNLDVDGTTNLDAVDIDGAVDMASSLTIAGNIDANGDLDVDGTTNLDVVDIDGAVDMASSLTIAGNIDANGDLDVDGVTNLDVVDIDGAVDMASTLTVSGQTDLNGDINLGNATSDTITPVGRFDAALVPASDGSIDLGTSSLEYKDLFIDGTAHIDTLDVDENAGIVGNATVGGTLGVTGESTLASAKVSDLTAGRVVLAGTDGAIEDSGNLTFDGSTVGVTGAVTASGTVTANQFSGSGAGLTGGTTPLSTLDIDGGTDIGADIQDADEFIVDDGGTGTNRKTDASRIKDYVLGGGQGANFSAINVTGITTVAFVDATQLKVSGVSTFTGTVDVNGAIDADGGGNIAGGLVADTAKVSDLTDGRVVLAGTDGELEDSGNLTFNGSQLGVTGTVNASSTVTASAFHTGAEGSAIRVTSNTISGPATITLDPAGVGDNTGKVVIAGDFQVDGTTTTVNSTTVTVTDKNILVADGAANDAAADGGGITIESGEGNKTFQFEATGDNLGSSENLNIASGKVYKVNNVETLSATTLGSAVVNSSLTNVGTLTGLTVSGNASIEGNVDLGNATSDTITATGRFDSDLVPSTDGARDLGTSTLEWKDLYLDGTAHIDTLDVDANAGIVGNATVGGTLGVTGESTLASAKVSDLTDGRVVTAGTDGALEDSANLTFNGSKLTVTGNAQITSDLDVDGGMNVSGGESTMSSATVSDLTSGRVVLAGTSGAIEDSGNLTFNGTLLNVTGNVTASGTLTANGDVDLGNATSDTITATGRFDSDLVPAADGTSDLGTSDNEWQDLFIDGTAKIDTLTVDENAGITGNLTVTGNSTFNGNIDLGDATSDTITATGRFDSDLVPSTDGARDLGSSSLEWKDLFLDGTAHVDTLDVDANAGIIGNATVGGTLGVTGESTLASATVSDLTAGRVVLAGTAGAIEDSGNLTFNGSLLNVTGAVTSSGAVNIDDATQSTSNTTGALIVDGGVGIAKNAHIGGTLDVDGQITSAAPLRNSTGGGLIAGVGVHSTSSAGLVTAFKFRGTGLEDFIVEDGIADIVVTGVAASTFTTQQTTVATEGQTAFTVSASYTNGFVDVYLNGIRLITGVDYTETNASTVTLASGATAGDEIQTVSWKELGDLIHVQSLKTAADLTVTGVATATGGFVGDLTGDVTGNADSATVGTTITVADESSDTTCFPLFATAATGNLGAKSGSNLTFNSNTGALSATSFAGSGSGLTAGTTPITTLDIDGATDIGGDLADADLFIVDDGAGGTNRKITFERLSENILGGSSGATFAAVNVTGIGTFGGIIDGNGGANISGGAGLVASTAKVSDLTAGRVVLAGTDGEIEDSGNLTFNGSKLTVTGNAQVTSDLDVDGGMNVSGGESVMSSATVSDLTSGRVVLAGTSGAIEDSGNLTFDGSTLGVTGAVTASGTVTANGAFVANGNVDLGNATSDTITATGRFDSDLVPSGDGARDLGSSTLEWMDLHLDGTAHIDTLDVDENAGIDGSLTVGTTLGVSGESTLASAKVSDLTSGRVVLAGTAGAIEDSGNLTFNGSTLAVTGSITASSNVTVTGNLTVNGTTTQINTVNTTIEDTLLELQKVDGGNLGSDTNKDVGIVMNYYDGSAKKAAIFWDDSAGRFALASEATETTGVLGSLTYGGLEVGSLYLNDCAGASQVISCSGTTRSLENITIDGGSF